MTKREVVGGSGVGIGRAARQTRPLLLAVSLLATAAIACKSGNSGQENAPATNPSPAVGATPQGADVVRYSGMEITETGQAGIRQAVQARRAADYNSTTVATLYPGTQVTRVAHYGNYSLVSWTGSAGAQQGWVDTSVAFAYVRYDSGVADPNTAVPAFGQPTVAFQQPQQQQQQPVPGQIAPRPVVTTPPVVTAPPPVVTAPPPKSTTTPPALPKTTPTPVTTTPKPGFKPPKLN